MPRNYCVLSSLALQHNLPAVYTGKLLVGIHFIYNCFDFFGICIKIIV